MAIKTMSHHSRPVNLVSRTYLKTKGDKIIKPIKCSKNIIVIGGSEYRCWRIRPSTAQSNAAIIINIGPAKVSWFFNIDLNLFLFE